MKQKSILVFFLLLSLILSCFACGGVQKKYADNPFLGQWICSEHAGNGSALEKAEDTAYDYRLEIFEQQKMRTILFGSSMDATWRQEGKDIICQSAGVDMHLKMEDGETINAEINNKLMYSFVKEESERGQEVISALANGQLPYDETTPLLTEPVLSEEQGSEPVLSEATEPLSTLDPALEDKWLDVWYGILEVRNATGVFAKQNNTDFDIWAKIFLDRESGRPVFEAYLEKDMTENYMSMFVTLNKAFVQPDIGEKDAWIEKRYLVSEDAAKLTFTESSEGFVMLTYDYVDPDVAEDKYSLTILMRRYGDKWEGRNLTPPSFETYLSDLESYGDEAPPKATE